MKRLLFLMLCSFIVLASSCDPRNGESESFAGVYHVQWGEELGNTFSINAYASSLPENPENYYFMTHDESFCEQAVSINNLHLGFAPHLKSYLFTDADDLYKYKVEETRYALANKTTSYIVNAGAYEAENLFSFASVNGKLSITADKVLFSRAPGTDLSDCFQMSTVFPPVRAEYPSYEAIDKNGSPVGLNLGAFFIEGMALSHTRNSGGLYEICFVTRPQEVYDTITFTISLPVLIYDYYAYLTQRDDSPRTSSTIMTGTTTIYFGKTAKENWALNQ